MIPVLKGRPRTAGFKSRKRSNPNEIAATNFVIALKDGGIDLKNKYVTAISGMPQLRYMNMPHLAVAVKMAESVNRDKTRFKQLFNNDLFFKFMGPLLTEEKNYKGSLLTDEKNHKRKRQPYAMYVANNKHVIYSYMTYYVNYLDFEPITAPELEPELPILQVPVLEEEPDDNVEDLDSQIEDEI